MERGCQVKLRAYGSEIITRRVFEDCGKVVYICTDEEYEAAEREGRDPLCVGFRRGDVVELLLESGHDQEC